MSATISRYVLVDENDVEQDYEYERYDEAQAEAERQGCAVIEREYEYSDSTLVWTPNASDIWPPRRKAAEA